MDKNRILEMISKASELTEDVGAFKGEASAAAAKIQELMEKYAISQMDIDNYRADRQEKEFKQAFTQVESEFRHKSIQEWEWSLARLIATVTMTRFFSSGSGKYGGKRMVFFGVKANAEVAGNLYILWHTNIEVMAEKARWANVLELKKKYGHIKKFRHWIAENAPEEDPRYFRSSWISGCLRAMHDKVWEEQKEREEGHSNPDAKKNSSAIVLYKAEVDKAYAVLSEGFRTVSTGGSKGFSSTGYKKGHETGSKIKIGSKQLE